MAMGTETALVTAMSMQMASSAVSGYQSYRQGKAQEKLYDKQAAQAIVEAKSEAGRLRLKHRRALADKKLAYMKSGIGGGMSVENVLASDINQMDMEARSVLASGAAKYSYLKTQGNIAKSEGRAKLIGGVMSGVSSALSTYAMSKQFGYFNKSGSFGKTKMLKNQSTSGGGAGSSSMIA